jgi:hypothetical protein
MAPCPTDHFKIAVPAPAGHGFARGVSHFCQHADDAVAMLRNLQRAAPTG